MHRTRAICDRCGWEYKLKDLREEYYDQQPTGLLVCWRCFDEDHPQLQVGRKDYDDPKPVDNPRPENRKSAGFGLFGWNPIGNTATKLTLKGGSA